VSCDATVTLVTRLVEAHAAEECNTTLQLEPLDLRALCAAASDRLRATASAKNQRIELTVPPTPAVARLDPGAFGQVLDNLLGNALKYSPDGATVECELLRRDERWRIDVRDEGPGVPIEERSRLFRKFHRGSARPTGQETSTGLGLFIARQLTEAMGGRVTHAPRPAPASPATETGGSVFRVEIPAARESMA
jgi:signal transduction histidine kinase